MTLPALIRDRRRRHIDTGPKAKTQRQRHARVERLDSQRNKEKKNQLDRYTVRGESEKGRGQALSIREHKGARESIFLSPFCFCVR